jgi:hypothetical protein
MEEQIRSAKFLVTKALADPSIIQELKTNTEATLKKLGDDAVKEIPRVLALPDQKTNNAIWLIIVICFSVVMVGAAYVLGAGATSKLEAGATYFTKVDTILTIFTTVVAFLAGLLAPSPIKK